MRDENNNGMASAEVISLIMTLTCASCIRGTNHFNYLCRKKMLPDLKNHGKTQAAQQTTTKRSNVNTEKLLRWHGTIDEALEEQKRLNKYDPHFLGLVAHFMMNLDESSMVAINGVLRVVGSAEKRKYEQITDENRDIISTIRVRSSAGSDGPRIYLTQGKKVDMETLRGDFAQKHKDPPGSGVYATPSAYLNDETWRKIAPSLCKGIRAMPIVNDHPDWWIVMTLDGFASHLDPEGLLIFSEHKILIVKEEGDTSQACQPYDQEVAKQDKLQQLQLLDALRINLKI